MPKLINWVDKPKEKYANVVEPDSFPERLRTIRRRKGFTQKQLAEKSGIEQCVLCHYEKGYYFPKLRALEWLCGALNVSASELLGF